MTDFNREDYYTAREVAELTGHTLAQLRRLRNNGTFPADHSVGSAANFYLKERVHEWAANS